MKRYTLIQEQIIEVVEVLMWAYVEHLNLWFTGEHKRCKRVEYNLPEIVRKGGLRVFKNGHKYVYTVPSNRTMNTAKMEHGLVCAEILLRFKQSREGDYVSEKFFEQNKFNAIPEWGIIYERGMILLEYSTADNFRRVKLMKRKVRMYRGNLKKFEDCFGTTAVPLFVFNAPRYKVQSFAQETGEDMYFVDLGTFMSVERGMQLHIPIYIWGKDGTSHPLSKHD